MSVCVCVFHVYIFVCLPFENAFIFEYKYSLLHIFLNATAQHYFLSALKSGEISSLAEKKTHTPLP